jgi:hypothetical protein
MYKKLSEWQQKGRQDGRLNDSGVDPTVWKTADDLVGEKKTLEARNSRLKAEILEARRRHFAFERGALTAEGFNRLEQEQLRIKARLADLDAQLAKKKQEHRALAEKERSSFEATFLIVAKDMLAEPVVARLITATLHRMAETQGGER